MPYKSQAEDEARDLFKEMDVGSEAELEQEIRKVFSEVCGEHGREEFFQYTFSAIKKVYGTNYRKAGRRLLDIIDRGAERKPEEIGQFFKNAVAKTELDFSQKNKDEILADMVQKINNLILEKKRVYGDGYKGVIGAIIVGSYAKKNFTRNSDLDIIYLTESKEESKYFPEREQYVTYDEDFDRWLNRKIRPPTGSRDYDIVSACIQDPKDVRGAVWEGEPYILVTPYPEVHRKFKEAMKQSSATQ